MKLSISLPQEDVEFLDEYAKGRGLESRSAAVRSALRKLRVAELADDYEAAWKEWEESGEAALWESTVGDGLSDQ